MLQISYTWILHLLRRHSLGYLPRSRSPSHFRLPHHPPPDCLLWSSSFGPGGTGEVWYLHLGASSLSIFCDSTFGTRYTGLSLHRLPCHTLHTDIFPSSRGLSPPPLRWAASSFYIFTFNSLLVLQILKLTSTPALVSAVITMYLL